MGGFGRPQRGNRQLKFKPGEFKGLDAMSAFQQLGDGRVCASYQRVDSFAQQNGLMGVMAML